MKKYIEKQPHKTTCGPVAVMNTLKFIGKKRVSYRKYLKKFTKLGFPNKKGGTDLSLMRKFLKFFKIKNKYIRKPTIKQLEKELDKGNAIILAYYYYVSDGTSGGHYTFIDGYDLIRLFMHNGNDIYISFKYILNGFFRSSKRWSNDFPSAWIIYKRSR